jgi:hypothetical protein
MSLADDLPSARPATDTAHPKMRIGDSVFDKVNALPIEEVLSWLGVETRSMGSKTIVKCPNCGAYDDTSSAIVEGGVKCLHASCSDAGPVGAPGFRTAVDLAMVVRGHQKPIDAVKDLAAAFGIEMPERRERTGMQGGPPPGDTSDEPPEGFFEDEPTVSIALVGDVAEPVVPPAPAPAALPHVFTEAELLQSACQRAASTTPRLVCSTGSADLDRMTGGFLPGWCWVVGANTNWGKSTWAVAVADTNLQAGRGVLIVSLEDSHELYGDRLLLRRARRSNDEKINADHLRLRRMTFSELELADRVRKEALPRPMFLDARGRKGEWIAKALAALLDGPHRIDLVIVDYLGEVRSGSKQQDRRNEVSEMAALIRGVVKRRDRALILLSQVTVGEDPDKFPRMNQIRDSRDVVNAAEVVAMCGIPPNDMKDKNGNVRAAAGERAMLLEKVKQGRKGWAQLHWDDESASFVDVEDDRTSDTDPRDPPLGRSWSPGAPAPRPYHEPQERDEYGIPDGFGGLPRN